MKALRIGMVVSSIALLFLVAGQPNVDAAPWLDGLNPNDTVYTSGNVGIGTNNPGAKLNIAGGDVHLDGGGYNFVESGASDVLAYFRGGTPINGIFTMKRFGPDFTILSINSPPVSFGAREATLSLVRGDEPNLELVDYYNNGYLSETQYGVRMIKRGTGQFRDFVFDYFDGSTLDTEVMRLTPAGNVGIGTATPNAKLHIAGGDVYLDGGGYNFVQSGASDVLAHFRGGTPTDGIFSLKRFGPDHTILAINSPPNAMGGREATLSLVRGDEPDVELVDFYNNGYTSETQYGIRMIKRGVGEFRDFVFDYYDGSSLDTEVMRMTAAGNVGIGTNDPKHKLDVASGNIQVTDGNVRVRGGSVRVRDGNVRVTNGNIRITGGSFIDDGTTLNVPDYVFEKGYKLMPLEELGDFIARKKHLPNIPSNEEIKKDGVNLSALQMRLLEKIEELTLHTLAQQEMLQAQQARIESLEMKLQQQ